MSKSLFPEVALADDLFELNVLKDGDGWQHNLGKLRSLRGALAKGAIIGTPLGRSWVRDVQSVFSEGLERLGKSESPDEDRAERARLRERYEAERNAWSQTLQEVVDPRLDSPIREREEGWLPLILKEHERSPFDRVYMPHPGRQPTATPDGRLVDPLAWASETADFDPPSKLEVKVDDPFARFGTFLKCQAKLTLIDGYIWQAVSDDAGDRNRQRWQKSLGCLGRWASQGKPLINLVIHTWAPGKGSMWYQFFGPRLSDFIRENFGIAPAIYFWGKRTDDHARYVLGEKRGVQIDPGLDASTRDAVLLPVDTDGVVSQQRKFSANARGEPLYQC